MPDDHALVGTQAARSRFRLLSPGSVTFDPSRRLALRRLWALLTGLSTIGGTSALAGNALAVNFSRQSTTATPRVGAYGIPHAAVGDNLDPISTAPLATQASRSTILACVGRGLISQHVLPTDNMGNTYGQLGTIRAYTLWPYSGTALYACPSAKGGSGHVVSVGNLSADGEVTLAVVEVMNGGVIKDFRWNEDLTDPNTSLSVTTTAPATLVAFWWGDCACGVVSPVPDAGWTVIASQSNSSNAVQCFVAVKDVLAGTHDVTWSPTPPQGAQLWLVAVQSVIPGPPPHLRIVP